MPNDVTQPSPPPDNPVRFEQEEARLWRIVMAFVILLATALAAVSWERLQSLPYHFGFVSIALLCVAVSFVTFTYGRRKRVAELKQLAESMKQQVAPSAEQLDQLSQVIVRSQRS